MWFWVHHSCCVYAYGDFLESSEMLIECFPPSTVIKVMEDHKQQQRENKLTCKHTSVLIGSSWFGFGPVGNMKYVICFLEDWSVITHIRQVKYIF